MNQTQITAAQHIYNNIVKKICTGIYSYGDKIPPIRELCENYGFASTTVKKALKQLREDGFIKGETSKGTSVIFDSKNPQHLERLRTYASQYTIDEYNDMKIPAILFSSILKIGMEAASKTVSMELKRDIENILSKIRECTTTFSYSQQLFHKIISQTRNPFIMEIFLDICDHSVFFIAPPQVNPQSFDKFRQVITFFYTALLEALVNGDLEFMRQSCMEMCWQLNSIPDSFFLMLGNRGVVGFEKEKLYSRLIQSISAEILSGRVKKGDLFPTTPQMCKRYGVSRKTIAKAYAILESLHLIQTVRYKGTMIIADRDQPEIKIWMKQLLHQWTQDTFYASEVFNLIGAYMFREMANHTTEEMIEKMEQNLNKHWYNAQNHNMLMLITDALITPLVFSLESSIFHRQYDFLITYIIKFAAVCSFQMHDENYNLSKNIYDEALLAIEALKQKDVDGFMEHFSISVNLNTDLYLNIKDKLDEQILEIETPPIMELI